MTQENVFQDGPHLAAALLCERVIEEKDGVKSLMRLVDRIVARAGGPNVPDAMPPLTTNLTLFLSMKAGKKEGRHQIRIKLIHPAGRELPDMIQGINFESSEARGIDVRLILNLILDQDGLYWFEVYFDELFMTRVPLRVLYLTQTQGKEPVPLRPQ